MIENAPSRVTVASLLASRIVAMIEESGAAKTEVLSALGVVYALLPTLNIPDFNGDDRP